VLADARKRRACARARVDGVIRDLDEDIDSRQEKKEAPTLLVVVEPACVVTEGAGWGPRRA